MADISPKGYPKKPIFEAIQVGSSGNCTNIDENGVSTFTGTAKRKITLRPVLTSTYPVSKPTLIQVGAFRGYSLPVWNGTGNVDEELTFVARTPFRWDGVSDPVFRAIVAIADAEDIGDKFQFQFSWNHASIEDVLSASTHDVTHETTILSGRTAQYNTYSINAIIDFDIDSPNLTARDLLGGRLRRVAASSLEVTNEILVIDWIVEFNIDKIYGSW